MKNILPFRVFGIRMLLGDLIPLKGGCDDGTTQRRMPVITGDVVTYVQNEEAPIDDSTPTYWTIFDG